MKSKELTWEEAVKICKSIWSLVLSGKYEDKHESTTKLHLIGKYINDCPLCEYVSQQQNNGWISRYSCVKHCPYYLTYRTNCENRKNGYHYLNHPKSFASRVLNLPSKPPKGVK